MYFLPLLEESQRGTRVLYSTLENEAVSFASLLVARYKDERETAIPLQVAEDRDGEADLKTRRVQTAYKILSGWHGFPGIDLPPSEREQVLLEWSRDVLRLSAELHRKAVGEIEVARILARASEMFEDGQWPCRAAREFLEGGLHSTLEDEIFTAKRNLRGMTTRAIGEGGQQESVLAAGFRAGARKLRIRWARTAALLDRLAESYEREAEVQDAEAKTQRRLWGEGPL